jgi:uncharacterized membrane protein YphA (DoxX/SURF4 family)
MHDIAIGLPPLLLIKISISAVWLYEGLWCKVLGRMRSQVEVVSAVPGFGSRYAAPFLVVLGVFEVVLGLWVLTGIAPGLCAIVQTALLITLNLNGLLWARHVINDPAGMIVKNAAFLLLVWIAGAMPAVSIISNGILLGR